MCFAGEMASMAQKAKNTAIAEKNKEFIKTNFNNRLFSHESDPEYRYDSLRQQPTDFVKFNDYFSCFVNKNTWTKPEAHCCY